MKQIKRVACAGLLTVCVSTPGFAYRHGFMDGEHKALGDSLVIAMPGAKPHANFQFKLKNGLAISYGDLVAMGDFYGIPGKPISSAATENERINRFKTIFDMIAVDPAFVDQSEKIMTVMQFERNYIQTAITKGETPKQAYDEIEGEVDRQYNCATGGGCDKLLWWTKKGRFLQLGPSNYDHFGNDAWLAYAAGHKAAINEALLARQTGDLSHLNRAYAMNAFASHFLSDRYAAGHIRTPRRALNRVTPSIVGSLLAKYMHDEDSQGLNVHNQYGKYWRAYGDGNFFEQKNLDNRRAVTEAMQHSIDEVNAAYQTGSANVSNIDEEMLLPVADEVGGVCGKDRASLFYLNQANNKIYRRWLLEHPEKCRFTSIWFGWSTLTKLIALRGLPVHLQAELSASSYANEAVAAGLITDKIVLSAIKHNTISG